MTPARLAAAAIVAVLVVGGTAFALMSSRPTDHSFSPSTSAAPSGVVAGGGLPRAPLVASSHADLPYDPSVAHDPTAGAGQSKLWFAGGSWWATLIVGTNGELHIARLDLATQDWVDTGTLVDERRQVRADAVWDGKRLTIVTAGDKATDKYAARVIQFTLDAAANRFIPIPDVPISLTATGVTEPVVAADSTGVLWLVYRDAAGALVVRHADKDVQHWSPAAPPAIDGADQPVRTATIVADGSRVLLAWNGADDDVLHLAEHADGADPGAWTVATTQVGGLLHAPGGLSVQSVDVAGSKRVFVAFETAPDLTANANALAPGAIVMVLDAGGSWMNVQLARVKDHFSDPILIVDRARSSIIAIGALTNAGRIVFKETPLDHIAFDSGRGTDLIASDQSTSIRNPTTTKQPVDPAGGLVVLASDDNAGHYLHGILAPAPDVAGGPSASAPPASSSPSPSGPAPSGAPPPPGAATILLHDTFDPFAPGTRSPIDWIGSGESGGKGRVVVTGLPSATNHSLRIDTTTAVGSMRACKSFAPTADGALVISELFQVRGVGGSDATIASIRGPGGEAAAVRVTRHRLFAYFNGAAKVTTTRAVTPGVWYRSTIVVHLADHTYDWTVATSSGRAIQTIRGVAWRIAAIPSIDKICVQSPEGRGAAILVDNLEVRR